MNNQSYNRALQQFDGNNPAPLEPFIKDLDADEISKLIYSSNSSEKHQIANTWLTKAWTDQGNSLSDDHLEKLCEAFLLFNAWPAKLHTYQILKSLAIPSEYMGKIHEISYADTHRGKTILRAWAFFVWAKTAPESEKQQTKEILQKQLHTEKGAVAVRIREALKLLN